MSRHYHVLTAVRGRTSNRCRGFVVDHSRFLLAGRWILHEYKINVFIVLHEALARWGLPQGVLQTGGASSAPISSTGCPVPVFLRRLGIELRYARKARMKGKIENQFRFIQRDFVLENLHHSRLDALNAAWAAWVEWYNWEHRHKGLTGDCPADHYVRSLRQPTPEDLELLLIHEESWKVTRTGHISYYGQFFRVPDRYIGRRVWAVLKGDTLRIECGKEVVATYQVKTDYLKAFRQDS